jgi:pyruvate/2-oxoglutarate/acetoin dehydrogenase E1 component/TPP-dependent pyruvate/acetoin dehydrogenase alpha subunit
MLEKDLLVTKTSNTKGLSAYEKEVIADFRLACLCREISFLARKEVLNGRAKFAVTADGKEIPQIAMAKVFKKGDFWSGYYREQTFMFHKGIATPEQYFAHLYADAVNDPFSGGRQMNNHFSTPLIDKQGNWTNHKELYNAAAGISCTAGMAARALGLAFASKKYRENSNLANSTNFSTNGNEVCFMSIGDASTSEGVFFETINAAGVLRVPLAIFVWDDGYGISVPSKYQTTKQSISEALVGFKANEKGEGLDIYTLKAWDYEGLCKAFERGIQKTRETHIPVLFHVQECTQQQGHSTSGSHERYKSKGRLQWEKEMDCNKKMGEWLIKKGILTQKEILEIKAEVKAAAKAARDTAWTAYEKVNNKHLEEVLSIYSKILAHSKQREKANTIFRKLKNTRNLLLFDIVKSARQMRFLIRSESLQEKLQLDNWLKRVEKTWHERYHRHLYSESPKSALKVPIIPPRYSDSSPRVNAYQLINRYFDKALEKHANLYAFGEDVGQIGDVNQGFAGMQQKYGEERVFDVGIRELTIMGQAMGMAMRGLRPIAEIQYLDYFIYGMQTLSDDLATLRYRSDNNQQAPAIIRTRGHRLEGIWHSGSPMGMMIHSLRGMYLLVPRNMTQAAGFYNTMLQSDDPAVIVECLNGYRLKEKLPDNIGEYTVPLGVPEVLLEGTDITLVTYGSCVRVAQEAIKLLVEIGISVELIDVQSLLPFDLEHRIVESIKKTNAVLFLDEDVPGGASAYMLQEVLEVQEAYKYLDCQPKTLTAKAHRPPYGDDGNYFSKPSAEDVLEAVYEMVYERAPRRFE